MRNITMRVYSPTPIPQKGFALLEVLITVVILSVALLSLGGLHTAIIKSADQAKVRGIATSLAQTKIDDLRSFGLVGTDSSFDFDSISSSSSGNAGNTLPTDTVTFSRNWYIYPLYYCNDNALPTKSNCVTPKTSADAKLIEVTVFWTDREGTTQNVALQSIIAPSDSYAAAGALQPELTGGPQKIKNPAYSDANDDIAHDLGSVLKRVSQPVPDTNRGNNDTTSNTITSFKENYFNTSNQLIGENEFVTVNCYCNQLGAPTNTTDSPFGLEPTVLSSSSNKYIAGSVNTSKRRGERKTTGDFNDQPLVCNVCCRDHHEDSSQVRKFDPFRPSSDINATISSDHNHYAPASNTATTANATNDLYAEACRMAWVDGRLRVLEDWRLESLQILEPNYLNNSSNITTYTNYISAFVTQFVMSLTDAYPGTMPDRATLLASNTSRTIVGDATISGVATALAALPSSWTMLTSPENLTVRGIYIDYMDRDQINIIRCKMDPANTLLSGGTHSSCSDYGITAKEEYLYLIPFHDVNLTKLATWTSSNGTNITVTSDALLNSTESTFSRGKITGVTANTRAGITASISTSNTGLTVTEATDPDDSSSTSNPISDCLPVTYGSSSTSNPCNAVNATKVQGTITVANNRGINPNDVYITVKDGSGNNLCTTTPGSTGAYDTSACGSLLTGATSLQLYFWHYSTASKDNCADFGSTTHTSFSWNADSVVCSGASCSSTSYFNTGGSQGEYTQVVFNGLTPNGTTTFNMQIQGDGGACESN